MKHDAFGYSFTGKELIYKLFKKKICPVCGSTMVEIKTYQTKKGKELNRPNHKNFNPGATVKAYEYYYHCEKCNAQYSLNELSNK